MSTTYRPRPVTAQMIYDDLLKHGRSDRWKIQRRAGLSYTQFNYGVGYLKDVLQTKYGRPLIWQPRRGVYALTTVKAEAEEYTDWTLVGLHKRLSRVERNLTAQMQQFGKTKDLRVAHTSIESTRKMIEALLP